jgi:hypothetical protein
MYQLRWAWLLGGMVSRGPAGIARLFVCQKSELLDVPDTAGRLWQWRAKIQID